MYRPAKERPKPPYTHRNATILFCPPQDSDPGSRKIMHPPTRLEALQLTTCSSIPIGSISPSTFHNMSFEPLASRKGGRQTERCMGKHSFQKPVQKLLSVKRETRVLNAVGIRLHRYELQGRVQHLFHRP